MKLTQNYFEFFEPRTAKYKCLVAVLLPVAATTEATQPEENVTVCGSEKLYCVPVTVAIESTQCQQCVLVYVCEDSVHVVAYTAKTPPPDISVPAHESLKAEDFAADKVPNNPPIVAVGYFTRQPPRILSEKYGEYLISRVA